MIISYWFLKTTQTSSNPLQFINKLQAIINDQGNKSSDRFHAQELKICLIIVAGQTSNFRQEIR